MLISMNWDDRKNAWVAWLVLFTFHSSLRARETFKVRTLMLLSASAQQSAKTVLSCPPHLRRVGGGQSGERSTKGRCVVTRKKGALRNNSAPHTRAACAGRCKLRGAQPQSSSRSATAAPPNRARTPAQDVHSAPVTAGKTCWRRVHRVLRWDEPRGHILSGCQCTS